MRKAAFITTIMIIIAFSACNIDSGSGVLQMAHNATEKTDFTISDVYGYCEIDDEMMLIISRDNDLWATNGLSGDDDSIKILDLTQGTMSPILVTDNGTLYYTYKEEIDDLNYKFAYVDINEIIEAEKDENGDGFNYLQDGTPFTPNLEVSNVTKFNSFNMDLKTTQIIYGNDTSTYYAKIEDRNGISGSDLNIVTYGEVDRASIVFGDNAVYSFYDDSDLPNASTDQIIVQKFDGRNVSVKNNTDLTASRYYVPMGYDDGLFITFNGYLYMFEEDEDKDGYADITRLSRGFVSDLKYRVGHRLILSTEDDFRDDDGDYRIVGFVYRNGIYYRSSAVEENYENPRGVILSINDNDNDVICTSYIGMRERSEYYYYLYATQNNSFILLEISKATRDNGRPEDYAMFAYDTAYGTLDMFIE